MSWSPLYRPCMSTCPWSHRPCYYVLVTTVQNLHVSESLIAQTLLLGPGHHCTDLACQWVLDRTDLVIRSWSPLYKPSMSVSPRPHRPCYYVLVITVQTLHVSVSLIAQTDLIMSWSPLYRPCTSMSPWSHRPCYYILVTTDLARQWVLDRTDLVIMSWSPLYRPCTSVSPWLHRPCYYVLVSTVQTLHVSKSLIAQTLLCPGHHCTDLACQRVLDHTDLVIMSWSSMYRLCMSVCPSALHTPCVHALSVINIAQTSYFGTVHSIYFT